MLLHLKHSRSVEVHGLFTGTIRFADFSLLLGNAVRIQYTVYFFLSRISGRISGSPGPFTLLFNRPSPEREVFC